jgi:hypothetical protein
MPYSEQTMSSIDFLLTHFYRLVAHDLVLMNDVYWFYKQSRNTGNTHTNTPNTPTNTPNTPTNSTTPTNSINSTKGAQKAHTCKCSIKEYSEVLANLLEIGITLPYANTPIL